MAGQAQRIDEVIVIVLIARTGVSCGVDCPVKSGIASETVSACRCASQTSVRARLT